VAANLPEGIHLTAGAADKCAPGLSVAISHNSQDSPCLQVVPVRNGLTLSFFDQLVVMQTAAEAYHYLGWSVIPFLSDLNRSRPKVPVFFCYFRQNILASLNSLRTPLALFSTDLPTSHNPCRDSTSRLEAFPATSSIEDSNTSVAPHVESSEAVNEFSLVMKTAPREWCRTLLFSTGFSSLGSYRVGGDEHVA